MQLNESIIAQESARTESAKAQLQLERADKIAEKTEKQVEALQQQVNELRELAHQSEIKAAVAEARVQEIQKKNTVTRSA